MWKKKRPKRETLHELHHVHDLSLSQIGERYSVAKSTIWRWMDDDGIERKEPGRQNQCPDREELFDLRINRKLTQLQIAERFGVSVTTVRRWIARCALPDQSSQSRAANLPADPRLKQRLDDYQEKSNILRFSSKRPDRR